MIADMSIFLAKNPMVILIIFISFVLYLPIGYAVIQKIFRANQAGHQKHIIAIYTATPIILTIITIFFLMLYGIFANAPAKWFSHLAPNEARFFRHKMENPPIPLTGNINALHPLSILGFANLQAEYQKRMNSKENHNESHQPYLQKQLNAMHYKKD